MYEHNALGYRLGLALCLTKVRSSRARCPATALIANEAIILRFTKVSRFELKDGVASCSDHNVVQLNF